MAGELQHRFTGYFAVAYLLKEPWPGNFLALGGLVLLFRSKIDHAASQIIPLGASCDFLHRHFDAGEQIGIRYILPVLPFAHLLGGMALASLFTSANKWGRWVAEQAAPGSYWQSRALTRIISPISTNRPAC